MKNKNIIFLLIDGVRQDSIVESKELSNISKDGIYFSNMITHAPYTLASMAAIFSGMYGGRNGIDAYNKMFKYKENCKFLAEYLQEAGYVTIGDTMRLSLCPKMGFDTLTSHDEKKTNYIEAHSRIIKQLPREKPFFLYLHYPLIHTRIVENVFDKYDDFSVEYFNNHDSNLKNYKTYVQDAGFYSMSIIDLLKELNIYEDSLIVLMADHGMGTGEKIGERAYGVFTYDYSLKTFAILINDDFPDNREVKKMIRSVDIMPTILDYLNISEDKGKLKTHGHSLLRGIHKGFNNQPNWFNRFFKSDLFKYSFSETGGLYGPWPSPDEPNVKCIRDQEWKLIHNCTPNTWELYNIETDPDEERNLYEDYPDQVKRLKKEMINVIESY
tara:strand:+ start:139 stop:1290 length:1152 start_codon:yes stop_codon:yes gene_type:complete